MCFGSEHCLLRFPFSYHDNPLAHTHCTPAKKDALSIFLIFQHKRVSDRTLDRLPVSSRSVCPNNPPWLQQLSGGGIMPASLLLGLFASSQDKPDELWQGLPPTESSPLCLGAHRWLTGCRESVGRVQATGRLMEAEH